MNTAQPVVALAYLHPGVVTFGFHDSVVRVMRDSRYKLLRVTKQSSAEIYRSRNALWEWAVRSPEVDYLWWLDADIVFPTDTLALLLAAKRPITSALYWAANEDGTTWPCGLRLTSTGFQRLAMEDVSRPGLVPVDGIGMGCCLISRAVIDALGTRPLWPYGDSLVNGHEAEGDVTFCLRAKEAGFPAVVDTEVLVSHLKLRRVP